jgi:outer membrane protein assembly factor BamD (BamD/ComL family)
MKRHYPLIAIALIALCAASCASVPTPDQIPADLTASQLIQRAQEASDMGELDVAIAYYEAAIAREPRNSNVVIQCKYEIAFIHYKQGKYEMAETELVALLQMYETDKTYTLPMAYKRLAEIVLEKVRAAMQQNQPAQ